MSTPAVGFRRDEDLPTSFPAFPLSLCFPLRSRTSVDTGTHTVTCVCRIVDTGLYQRLIVSFAIEVGAPDSLVFLRERGLALTSTFHRTQLAGCATHVPGVDRRSPYCCLLITTARKVCGFAPLQIYRCCSFVWPRFSVAPANVKRCFRPCTWLTNSKECKRPRNVSL